MPDEQLSGVGLGPAGMENPEEGGFATRESGAPEASPVATEQEPAIEGAAPEKKYEKLLSHVTTQSSASDDDAKVDLEHLNSLEGEEEKVAHLTQLATTKGLPHAIMVAQRLKDYYALDTFHDELIDNLYDELLKAGLITKE
jgi:hypothetical protein